jgi:hypothetical protein
MVEPRISAMQRIQVGLVGLVIVLLFVSLANLVMDRVAQSSIQATGQGGLTGTEIASQPEKPKAEPLAELGVAPVIEEVQAAKQSPAPAQQR